MKTVFEHKPDFTFREFAVEKTVTIPARKLEEMLRVIDRELMPEVELPKAFGRELADGGSPEADHRDG